MDDLGIVIEGAEEYEKQVQASNETAIAASAAVGSTPANTQSTASISLSTLTPADEVLNQAINDYTVSSKRSISQIDLPKQQVELKLPYELKRTNSGDHDPELGEAAAVYGTGWWAFAQVCVVCCGVIYGDIGTSPIYTVATCMSEVLNYNDVTNITDREVYGICSLLFWSLTLIPSLKYCYIVLSATMKGQGGTFALLALLEQPHVWVKLPGWVRATIVPAALIGVALLIGDGVLTPCISVISAIEGIQANAPDITRQQIVGIAIAILAVLFVAQQYGTTKIGGLFGPFTIAWLLSIGSLGIYYVSLEPSIFRALNPYEGLDFFIRHGSQSYTILGFVLLVFTGAEAMYVDMGQFGARAVRWSWLFLSYPCLVLQYLGQGAVILHTLKSPTATADDVIAVATNAYFTAIPSRWFWPQLVLTTVATIIASQAAISGTFVTITQAVNLHYFPRVKIMHTDAQWWSRVYLPTVNWVLMALTLIVAGIFQTSANLTNMYGLNISIILVMTTCFITLVMIYVWSWPTWKAMLFFIPYIFIDGAFMGSLLFKFTTGGYVPAAFALVMGVVLIVYRYGHQRAETSQQQIVEKLLGTKVEPGVSYLHAMAPLIALREVGAEAGVTVQKPFASSKKHRLAVFFTRDITQVPLGLTQLVKSFGFFPETVLLLQVNFVREPFTTAKDRLTLYKAKDYIADGVAGPAWLHAAVFNVGFAEQAALTMATYVTRYVLPLLPGQFETVSYYVSSARFAIPTDQHNVLARSVLKLFEVIHHNEYGVTEFFHLPTDQTMYVGTQIPL